MLDEYRRSCKRWRSDQRAAEEVTDPLENLVAKTEADPGSAFAPEVVQRLAQLKREHGAAYEALRTQLKKAGCRVTALDKAVAGRTRETSGRHPTQADTLIELAQSAELFHTPDRLGYADLVVNGHRETWPIRGKGFRRWIVRRYFESTGGAPSAEALQSALNVIEAKAHFDCPERLVYVRVGEADGRLYLDLGDETWSVVEVDTGGWRIIDNPPVRFRRSPGVQPLPVPIAGGSIEELRPFLNLRSDTDFVLVVAWALACFRNRGPYPVMRNPHSPQSCGRWSIRTPPHCAPYHERIATCSLPQTTVTCLHSTICPAYLPGFPTRFAA